MWVWVWVWVCVSLFECLCAGIYCSHPIPTPWFAPNLANPPPGLHMPCQNKTAWHAIYRCRGKTSYLCPPPICMYIPKSTPCCKLCCKSLVCVYIVQRFYMYLYTCMFCMRTCLMNSKIQKKIYISGIYMYMYMYIVSNDGLIHVYEFKLSLSTRCNKHVCSTIIQGDFQFTLGTC